KSYPVGRSQNAVEADFLGVSNRLEEVRGERRLPAGKEHDDLPARLEGNGAVENRLDVLPFRFVNVADLVGIHEAGIAHHVAPVGHIHGQDRAPAKLDRGTAVTVDVFVFRAPEVSAKEETFNTAGEVRVGGENILKRPVFLARLAHEDSTVFLYDLRLDFARVFVSQQGQVGIPIDDGGAYFGHTARAKGVCDSGKTEGRGRAFIALEHLARRPLRSRELSFRKPPVNGLESLPGQVRKPGNQRCSPATAQQFLNLFIPEHVDRVHLSAPYHGIK